MNQEQLLNEINKRLMKIESYLYNDDETGKDGVVRKLDKVDRRVYLLEEKDKIEKAKSATWGIVGGGLLAALIKGIEILFK